MKLKNSGRTSRIVRELRQGNPRVQDPRQKNTFRDVGSRTKAGQDFGDMILGRTGLEEHDPRQINWLLKNLGKRLKRFRISNCEFKNIRLKLINQKSFDIYSPQVAELHILESIGRRRLGPKVVYGI